MAVRDWNPHELETALHAAGYRGPVDSEPLDASSKAIINVLQHDGRTSYADLARQVGLSETAVRQRVQRLTEAGTIQIVAVTDPLQLGFRRQAMVGIKVSGDIVKAADAIAAIPETDYVVTTAGRFDLIVEIVCEDDDHMLRVVNDQIRSVPGVQSTEAFVYLRLNKQHYDWGTR